MGRMDESPDGLYPAMIAESAIIATTNIPARSSTRPNPGVAPRRGLVPSANAIHSGMAVRASAKLWMVSAASAIDPDNTTTTIWASAVMPSTTKLILTARMPAALDSSSSSKLSAASWECGRRSP
jgi:hypothetical protein